MADERDPIQRQVLPIPDRPYAGLVTYDAKDPATSFPPIEPLRPPEGAPNVLIVLIDDCGFGASSAFGGPCSTPTAERLAANGLKYNRFHTTALCSPTRQALLTGRNHHSVGMGGITEIATSAPGYNSIRPNTCAPLAETLRLNGYSTAQFGKCHEVPVWETSPLGPFHAWPTGSGFEHFYGFIGGETNQYAPAIYRDTVPIEQPKTAEEGYHFTEDMTDEAIDWVKQQKALMPDKPFFMYFAPGATHAPHHVPTEWSDKYKGAFDDGWDALRGRTFAKQKELGVIPADGELTERPAEIPAWDDMPDDLKPVLARQMEVYAGFLEHTDHHVGRLIDALAELEILESTLVYYVIGDNGASAEGTPTGCFNELVVLNGAAGLETTEFMVSKIDDFGTPAAYNHYAVGWAHAMDTPYQWTKQIASHWGGTRNGTIVHWPSGIRARGEVRSQFHHVIDVAPTILEAAALPAPLSVNGVQQRPLEGVSMAYSFDDARADDRHTTQYFEMFCNRGIYHEGWTAVTRHSIPWVGTEMPAFDDDVWELYGPGDWTQAHDVAAEQPEKLAELQRLFLIEAGEVQRAPARRSPVRAVQPRPGGTAAARPWGLAAPVRSHGPPVGELDRRVEEQVARDHRADRGARERCERRDHLAGRGLRRARPLREGRKARVLLQPLRPRAVQGLRRRRRPRRRSPGADGVHVRRRRPREGRRRHALRRRRAGRRGARRRHRADALLGGRDDRRGKRHRDPGQRRLRHPRQRLHRHGPLGPARPRRGGGGHRPPDLTRGAAPGRDGETVGGRREARGPSLR